MPPSEQDKLFDEFLQYQREQEKKAQEVLTKASGSKSSLIPTAAYNPNGTINYGKLLAKLSNPSVLLAIIVAATNLYIEYQALKVTVKEQKEQIENLEQKNQQLKNDTRSFLDKTRNQFTNVERINNDLRIAISNVQTEVRVRHGASSESTVRTVTSTPRPAPSTRARRVRRLSSREQLELLNQEANSALERVEQRQASQDPLAGLDF